MMWGEWLGAWLQHHRGEGLQSDGVELLLLSRLLLSQLRVEPPHTHHTTGVPTGHQLGPGRERGRRREEGGGGSGVTVGIETLVIGLRIYTCAYAILGSCVIYMNSMYVVVNIPAV